MIKRMSQMTGSTKLLGGVVLIGLLVAFVLVYQKERVVSVLSPGDMVTASFSRDYKLERYISTVKLASVRVGEVTDIEKSPDGSAEVTMRLDKGIKEKLGGQPSAAIRPTLITGGVYYIELTPGGRGQVFDGRIPLERTTVPVELDHFLAAINTDAQKGLQGFTRHFDDTLRQGGRDSIRRFLHEAPPALKPTGEVLTAVRGTEPGQDLTRLVSGFEGFAAVFNRKQGQFADIIDSLNTSTGALNAERGPVADTLGTLPETMRTTRVGLADLQGSLDRLTDTAPRFRDSARELDPVMRRLGPVASDARPVVHDLRDVIRNLHPALRRLVRVADKGTEMFRDIHGPVLDRVNGPVKHAVLSPWHGHGVYANGGNTHKMYQEIAYLVTVLNWAFQYHDQNGMFGRLAAGENASMFTGGSQFPRSFEEVFSESLLGQKPYGPQDYNQKKHAGLSPLLDQRTPINRGLPTVPAPGPAPVDAGNPLLLPMHGGAK